LPITVCTAAEPPVPSVSLLLFVTAPRNSRALSVIAFVLLPSVSPEGLSTVIPSSGLEVAPVPVYVCASVSLTNASVLPEVVPVSVPLLVTAAPVTVSVRPARSSVEPVLMVALIALLAAFPAKSCAVFVVVVLSTTRFAMGPESANAEAAGVAEDPTCSVPPVIETVPPFRL
jgi:hypothetical protein